MTAAIVGGTPGADSIDVVLDLLACPHCGSSFVRDERSVRCRSGHTFDLARPGHLNLLGHAPPANADTAEMVVTRDRFLGGGAYVGLAGALAGAAFDLGQRSSTVIEVGAGTGYYLAAVVEACGGRGLALDVSPAAARRAARAHVRIGSVVADAWRPLPVRDGVADLVLSVFAPRNPPEFARMLTATGTVLIAAPLPEHLAELRADLGLLTIEADKQTRIEATMVGSFEPVATDECRYQVALDAAAVADLILMGPNAFHQERPSLLERLPARSTVTVAVGLSAWRRRVV